MIKDCKESDFWKGLCGCLSSLTAALVLSWERKRTHLRVKAEKGIRYEWNMLKTLTFVLTCLKTHLYNCFGSVYRTIEKPEELLCKGESISRGIGYRIYSAVEGKAWMKQDYKYSNISTCLSGCVHH